MGRGAIGFPFFSPLLLNWVRFSEKSAMDPGDERRPAAILAADMVGYSRLMEADETGTLARLRTHRLELVSLCQSYGVLGAAYLASAKSGR